MTVVTAFLAVTHVELGPVLPNVDLVAKEVEMGSVWAIVGDALMLTIEVFVFGKCAELVVTVVGILIMDFISPKGGFKGEDIATFGVFDVDIIKPPPTEFVEGNIDEELLETMVDPRISV